VNVVPEYKQKKMDIDEQGHIIKTLFLHICKIIYLKIAMIESPQQPYPSHPYWF